MWISSVAILLFCVSVTAVRTKEAAGFDLELIKRQSPTYSANGAVSQLMFPLETSAGKALQNLRLEPETELSTIGLIRRLGYPAEAHTVTTRDGYILELHRIPFGIQRPPQQGFFPRTPILLQHGLLCSSAEFANNFPNQSLAYILADNGFDVWLGNSRGNTYSRGHVELDPEQKEFWQFSWDQMAEFDLPATIDYILEETGFTQLYYVGHSQGTTIAFAMLSESEYYNDRIAHFFALGPVTDLANNTSPISHLVSVQELGLDLIRAFFALGPVANLKNVDSSVAKAIGTVPHVLRLALQALGVNEILPNTNLVKLVGGTICNGPSRTLCNLVLDAVFGYNPAQLNETRWPVYLSHFPAGTSAQLLVHWAQTIHVKDFRYFDYGSIDNRRIYGRDTPPSYNLQRIRTPVSLIFTAQDPLATPTDTLRLAKKLGSRAVDVVQLGDNNWVHMDLVWGLNAGQMIFSRMKKFLRALQFDYPDYWNYI